MPRAREIADEYMFGPAFLVSPVTAYKVRSRPVYLPSGTSCTTSGRARPSPRRERRQRRPPYDSNPAHIRAGAIIPFGPELAVHRRKNRPTRSRSMSTPARTVILNLRKIQGTDIRLEHAPFHSISLHWNQAKQT